MAEATEPRDANQTQCSFCGSDGEFIVSCRSDRHKFCIPCITNYFRVKTSDPDTFTYGCPSNDECHSELDPDLIRDILHNFEPHNVIAERIDKVAVSTVIKDSSQFHCPKCSTVFLKDVHDQSFEDLFVTCPECKSGICVTCHHALGPHGHSEHVCVIGAAINNRRNSRQFHCPKCYAMFLKDVHDQSFEDVFVTCPVCEAGICATCRHALGPYGYSDHICAPGAAIDKRQAIEETSISQRRTRSIFARFIRCLSSSARS